MNDEKSLEPVEYITKHLPKFSRKHWISSPRFDFIYPFIKKLEESPNLSTQQKEFIKKKLISCRYKLCSLEYHDRNIAKIEKEYKKTLKNILKNPSFKEKSTIATVTPEVNFEFEAFLFQCKAFLDIYSQAIGYLFNQRPSNLKKLRGILSDRKELLASDLSKLLEKNKWLKEFDSSEQFKKTKRDIIAHYSAINLSSIKVQKIEKKTSYTTRTKVEDKLVLDYTRNIMRRMNTLMKDTIDIIKYQKILIRPP